MDTRADRIRIGAALGLDRLHQLGSDARDHRQDLTAAQIGVELVRIRENLDDLASLGDSMQTGLQPVMDQRSKAIESCSNIMKKYATTEDSLIKNLK